jgi:drug/metabolite transporter (DMT)-like permease
LNKNSLLTTPEKNNTVDENLSQNKLIDNSLSLAILAIAIIALAFSPIFTKLSELELSPTTIIFDRLWISTIIVSCWQLIGTFKSEQSERASLTQFNFNYQESGLLLLASFSATASAWLWAISFTQTSIASSTVLRSLTPLFISLGAWLILKQRFKRQFVIGMTLAIIGAMVIGWKDLQVGNDYLVGDAIAFLWLFTRSRLYYGAGIALAMCGWFVNSFTYYLAN